MSKLFMSHLDGDSGNFVHGNTYDIFGLEAENGVILVSLRVTYATDDNDMTIKMSGTAQFAPFFMSDLHATMLMLKILHNAFTADHEFYADLFHDENGDPKRLEINPQ